jgi:hypothetical protein
MAESQTHLTLVAHLVKWLQANTGHLRNPILYIDLPEAPAQGKPPEIEGFNPDVYCSTPDHLETYIGEAKSPSDIEGRHSRDQFTAYLRHLRERTNGTLVVAVPWRCVPQMKSLIRFLQRTSNTQRVRVVLIEQLPG